jgi:aminomethyltransferase
MLKRTSLWASHQQLGGRLIEFGGWEMPVQYTGIVDEHLAVRNAAGIFDISHMGEIFVSGPAALDFLNGRLTNDLRKLVVGQGQYTLLCHERGGVVDDLYIYRIEPIGFLLVVNASRLEADVAWLQDQLSRFAERTLVNLVDASEQRGAIAVQGPSVADFIDQCFSTAALAGTAVERPTQLKKNELAAFAIGDSSAWVARTGYTGEDGFEIVAPNELIVPLWSRLLEVGGSSGLKPCGLGARDTLRTEMCYPLYGHELDENTTPIEAGLGSFVAFDKGEFVGRGPLAAQKSAGPARKLVAFKMTGKSAPPRPHYPLWVKGSECAIGEAVSGTQSPSLGIGIGLGYVPTPHAKPGTELLVEIRGKLAPAQVVPKPIYRKAV